MAEDVAIGIDLGTSYSCVSVVEDGQPVVIPNEWGELTHASAVLRKLQLSSRHQLTRWASDRRLV